MANQINIALYVSVAESYAYIWEYLDGLSAKALDAVYAIVDITSSGYTPAGGTNGVEADKAAALDVELELLDVFNASQKAVSGIASSTGSLLDAVRSINNYVITNYADYPVGGSSTTPDNKLKDYINDASVQAAFTGGTCPQGWYELSTDAGYDCSGWTHAWS